MPDRVIAFTADLIFSSKIEETLRAAGHTVVSVEDLPTLERELQTEPTSLVLLDLHAGAQAGAVVMLCQPLSVPVLAFGRHTEPELLRSARTAGCVEAVARSTFVEDMPGLVARATART